MKGAVDFMPATLLKAVQCEARRTSPTPARRATIFGTSAAFHEIPRVTQDFRGQSGTEGGEQKDTYSNKP
jgi:hypothetical protein